MKKNLVIIAVLSLFVATSGLTSQAVINNDKGVISVNTSAEIEIAPDVAEISFAVKTSDVSSIQKATLLNKELSDKVLVLLKSKINSEDGDYIKTSDFSANPVYSYINSKKTFDRYEVSNRVIVHTKSIDKIGEIIDKAIELGATNVDSLSFSLSNYEAHCNDLIATATQKAKTRAEVVAQALGANLNGISNISTSCSSNSYNPTRLYMAKNMIADVASETVGLNGVSISNGVVKVNANVNAGFFVK